MSNISKIKIVNTIGPSITQKIWDKEIYKQNPEMVAKAKKMCEEIIIAGSNVARFNFSHGSVEEHTIRIELLREASKKLNVPYSFLLDTKGPEIRVCKFPDDGILYEKGSKITIYTLKKNIGTKQSFCVYDATGKYNMAKDVKVGNKILVEDGKLILVVDKVNVKDGIIIATALNNHVVKTNKRINLPGATYTMPFVSAKDKQDVILACKLNLDYVAPSFVNNAKNVQEIRNILNKNGGKNIKIISKIESTEGIKNLDEIIKVSDGIMVARGDLGIEIPYYEVPYYQEEMIRKCRRANKPIIVATQMLDSMEKSLLATRAETTDVYVAGKWGTDATMTSGETAQGQYPINVIKTMKRINQESQNNFCYMNAIEKFNEMASYTKLDSKIKKQCLDIAKLAMPKNSGTNQALFPYECLIIFENNEKLINAISNIRPGASIIAVIDDKKLYNKFGLNYGIFTYLVEDLKTAKANYKKITKNALTHYSINSKKSIAYINNKALKLA